jgi:hypothetical protein
MKYLKCLASTVAFNLYLFANGEAQTVPNSNKSHCKPIVGCNLVCSDETYDLSTLILDTQGGIQFRRLFGVNSGGHTFDFSIPLCGDDLASSSGISLSPFKNTLGSYDHNSWFREVAEDQVSFGVSFRNGLIPPDSTKRTTTVRLICLKDTPSSSPDIRYGRSEVDSSGTYFCLVSIHFV